MKLIKIITNLWNNYFSCKNDYHDFTEPEMPFVLGYGWVIDWEIRKCKKCELKQKRKTPNGDWINNWLNPYK